MTKRARGMKRAMALATRVECDEESDGFGSKSNGDKCGRQLTATMAMAMVTATMWVMAMVTRLAGNKEGKGEGGKGVGDGDEGGRQREAMMTAARAVATVTMVAGE